MAKSNVNESAAKSSKQKKTLRISLTRSEVEILRKALMKYRQTLPIYIASKKEEVRIVDQIIEKLEG